MAFNPSPTVAAARDFARRFGKNRVIILYLDEDDMGYASYGETPALCRQTKTLADVAYDAVMEGASAGGPGASP